MHKSLNSLSLFTVATLCAVSLLAGPADSPVAVSQRLTQARTDSQPTLQDDLGGNRMNAGQAGSGQTSTSSAINWDALAAVKPLPPRVQILFFTAETCGFCKPALADMETRLKPAGWDIGPDEMAHIRILDFYQNAALAAQYGIASLPGFVVLRDGQFVENWAGYRGYEHLQKAQREAMAKAAPLPQAFGDIPLGKLSRKAIGLDQGVINVGGAKFVVPQGQVVTFEPGVVAGNGFISVTVTKVELQGDQLLLTAKRFPGRLVLELSP